MWWFLFGLLLGAGILALAFWLHARKVRTTWYEWIMGIISLILIVLLVQHFVGSIAEEETRAAWMAVLFLGIPALVLGVLAVRLPYQRQIRNRA
jgi:uncharacterized membrane protein HdeD (DUF308 family)